MGGGPLLPAGGLAARPGAAAQAGRGTGPSGYRSWASECRNTLGARLTDTRPRAQLRRQEGGMQAGFPEEVGRPDRASRASIRSTARRSPSPKRRATISGLARWWTTMPTPDTPARHRCETTRLVSRVGFCLAWLLGRRAVLSGEVAPETAGDGCWRLGGQDICLTEPTQPAPLPRAPPSSWAAATGSTGASTGSTASLGRCRRHIASRDPAA